MTRHCRTLLDLGREGVARVLSRAHELKARRGQPDAPKPLQGRSVAILLEKASTRTRISFEVGIHELGGFPLTLVARDTQLGRDEPVADTARMLGGYVHAAVYRTSGHDRIETLAQNAGIPIINGLSDSYHPCQVLADLMTVQECVGSLEHLAVAWIGDGNNMANSWILAAGLMGFSLHLACPEGHDPSPEALTAAQSLGRGTVTVTRDPREAIRQAQVINTDVWASMGQEAEAEARRARFQAYQVDETLMQRAHPDAIFLHCLPAHRGEEVSAAVIDGPASRVWRQAENRLHAQKALLEDLL